MKRCKATLGHKKRKQNENPQEVNTSDDPEYMVDDVIDQLSMFYLKFSILFTNVIIR